MNIQQKIDSRAEKLREILAGANARITAKNGTAALTLGGLPEAIGSIAGGGAELQALTVTPTGKLFTVVPDAGYDGFKTVTVAGDANLIPANIAKDITIYGLTGTHEGNGGGLELPTEYAKYLAHAKTLYNGAYTNYFIAENDEFVTVGFLTSAFEVTSYDPAAGDFGSIGWYSCKLTKASNTWETTSYIAVESTGYNYAKNIKYADCYIEYNGMTLFPVGINSYPDTTAIDYSGFDNGSFTETLETGDTLTYAVEFNADGQPNKITAPDGTVTWIDWGES